MILRQTIFIDSIKKKTKAKFFEGLFPGDVVELTYNLSGSYGYAPYITLKKGDIIHRNSASQLIQNLNNNFTYTQIL